MVISPDVELIHISSFMALGVVICWLQIQQRLLVTPEHCNASPHNETDMATRRTEPKTATGYQNVHKGQ